MLTQEKTRVPSANGKKGQPLISEGKFRQLYELALQLRAAGRGSAWLHGREALLAGLSADLRRGDAFVAENTSWTHQELRSQLPIMPRSPAGTMADGIVESLSDAMTNRLRKNGRVTIVLGPVAGAEAILDEARSLAGDARLPVIFVEDAFGQAAPKANGRSGASDAMPSIPVDADDVVAIYRVAHESIQRARRGGGPTRIVGVLWPTASDGRPAETAGDAVERLERWLVARGLPAQAWRMEIVGGPEAPSDRGTAEIVNAGCEHTGIEPQTLAQANLQAN